MDILMEWRRLKKAKQTKKKNLNQTTDLNKNNLTNQLGKLFLLLADVKETRTLF